MGARVEKTRLTRTREAGRRAGLPAGTFYRAAAWVVLALLIPAAGCGAGAADWYKAQLAALDKKKPILELRAQPGRDMVLSGVESLVVWSGEDGARGLAPYQDPWAPVVREGLGILGLGASLYLSGTQVVELAEAVGSHAGGNITGSLNAGGQAAVQYAPGGGAGQYAAPQANPSWALDDHSSRTGVEEE